MFGVENCMVVSDSRAALELYKKLFEVSVIEVTSLERGLNEAIFTVFGTRFHLLDENEKYSLFAPGENSSKSAWFNITVPDAKSVFEKAVAENCLLIQPLLSVAPGVTCAIFCDSFGYVWQVSQTGKSASELSGLEAENK